MSLTPAQCRAARALLNWSQDQLAGLSQVAKATIANFEAGNRAPYPRTLADIHGALERAGVEFTNGDEPGVKLKAKGKAKAKPNDATIGGRLGNKAVSKSSELAGKTIDRLKDKSAPNEEQEKRKRRLLKGPTEFRNIRDLASDKRTRR